MKRRYNEGGETDAMEEANKREDMALKNPNAKEYGESGTSYTTKAEPKTKPKTKPKAVRRSFDEPEPKLIDPANIRSGRREFEESQIAPADKTKMSVSERAKATRESARSGSGSTDKRSVNERIRSAMGMKNGGMTASKRADGIATKGKTRGKMC
jgi:hypothetical protein